MINLLPPNAKRTVRLEYWVRVGTVWAVLLAVGAFGVSALLLPSYILLEAKHSALEREVAEQGGTDAVFREAENTVIAANTLAEQLAGREPRTPASQVFEEISEHAGTDIVIRNFIAGEDEDGELAEVQVQGTAVSRESLASFKQRLERAAMFDAAIVPISDLARETNLPFVVTVVLAPFTQGS